MGKRRTELHKELWYQADGARRHWEHHRLIREGDREGEKDKSMGEALSPDGEWGGRGAGMIIAPSPPYPREPGFVPGTLYTLPFT